MKAILIFISTFIIVPMAVGQQRMLLYEEFSGENCPFDSIFNPVINALVSEPANTGKIIKIQYQLYYPSPGPLYNLNTADPLSRRVYYGVQAVPNGLLGGKKVNNSWHINQLTQPVIDNEAAVPSPFNMSVTHTWNAAGDSVTATVHVVCVANFAPAVANVKLRVALTETLQFVVAPGTNGETYFLNSVRKMYPDTSGTNITNVWTVGQSETFILTGAVPPYVNKAGETRIVAWIQNDADKVVAQAARSIPSITGIEKITDFGHFRLFPNPAKDNLTIVFDLLRESKLNIEIIDLKGSVVSASANTGMQAGEQRMVIPVTNLAAGVYSVNVRSDNGSVTKKLVITK